MFDSSPENIHLTARLGSKNLLFKLPVVYCLGPGGAILLLERLAKVLTPPWRHSKLLVGGQVSEEGGS